MLRAEEKKLSTLSPFEVKNTLIKLANSHHEIHMINAGRGNPNWVATAPREAFFYLGQFALEESKKTFQDFDGFGGVPQKEGIAKRLRAFIKKDMTNEGLCLLEKSLDYATKELKIDEDEFVNEFVNGILGDNYPVPDRMLKQTESVVHDYLIQEMCAGSKPPKGKFDIFATEGGTAAMVYIFNTLKSNHLLNPGDTIALGAPIFTPYIEIPELDDYRLKTIEVTADENLAWQIPDSEIEKLRDKTVKAFFLVNPSNPPSVKLNIRTLNLIADVVKERPDLIILTDDVYGTFTNNFTSLAMIAPKNTILVYSYSKYFGATGWRLGTIALHEDNMLDKMIQNHPKKITDELNERYGILSLEPQKIKLIDRFVADSRAVALNHTAGLSTPQQIQMALFSLLSLTNKGEDYKKSAKQIIKRRYSALMEATKVEPIVSMDNEDAAFYYVEIDILRLASRLIGDDFATWLVKEHDPLDFLIRLAEEKSVVAMPGGGFDAPVWSLRLSLANLYADDYRRITKKSYELLEEYHHEFGASGQQ